MFHLSEPIHKLQIELRKAKVESRTVEFDVVVIGSGYGGAVAAARFAEAGLRVLVLERGKEYVPGEFPNNLSEAPSHVRIEFNNEAKPWGYEDGLFDIRIGGETATILGNGLGGGSQINANVALEPDLSIFEEGWPTAIKSAASRGDFAPYFDKVRSVIGVTGLSFNEAEKRFPKTRGLARLAANDGDEATVKKPLLFKQPVTPIAVKMPGLAYMSEQATGSFARAECTGCGNCVSGCNVGAKGTLTTNYLPIAKGFNAQIYTGATALAVEEVNGKWHVTGIPTAQRGRLRTWEEIQRKPWVTGDSRGELEDQFFDIETSRVVISAGTLGTAEILQRSTKGKHKLTLSKMLGAKFSGNGDYLAFSYGESEDSVNAVGWSTKEDQVRDEASGQAVGPTITATLVPRGVGSRFIVQDGAVPGPIAPGVRELWAFSNALSGSDKPFDPIALDPVGLDHTQTFLGIGIDSANGQISANPKTGRVHVAWPQLKNEIKDYGNDIRKVLMPATERVGGTYLDNPTWKLLPPFLEVLLSKDNAIRGVNPISHPLGGCVMADDAKNGVVDHCGRVFSGSTGIDVHTGLYVLDGSIVHGAVGKNPFLTIAALAERAVKMIIDEEKLGSEARALTPTAQPSLSQLAFRPRGPIGISLSEVLRGSFKPKDGGESVIAALDLTFSVADFAKWQEELSTPFVVHETSVLRLQTAQGVSEYTVLPGSTLKVLGPVRFKSVDLPPLAKSKAQSLAIYEGLEDWPKVLEIINRLRDRFKHDDIDLGKILEAATDESGNLIGGVLSALMNSLQVRDIVYDLKFDSDRSSRPVSLLPKSFNVSGGKHIAMYDGWNPPKKEYKDNLELFPLLGMLASPQKNIFRMVTMPTLQIEHKVDKKMEAFTRPALFKMDLADTLHRNLPQILTGDTSHGLVALMGYPLAFFRFTVRSLLLSFRVPGYQRDFGLTVADKTVVDQQAGGYLVDIKPTHWLPALNRVKPMLYDLPDFTSANGAKLRLALWRYKQNNLAITDAKNGTPQKCKAVLMLHAFGQSALSFADASIKRNGATVLYEAGYDVWLLDYRTSTALDGETKAWADDSYVEPCRRAATMDEIAAHDVPAAIKFIRKTLADENSNKALQIFAFAQCVGSASLAMSALSGKLKDSPQDKNGWLAVMVLSQFMPYCIAGEGTQARTSVPAFLRDVLRMPGVNFSTLDTAREADEAAAFAAGGVAGVRALKGKLPPRAADAYQSTMTDTLIDVIAGVYPTDDDEVHHGDRKGTPYILQTQAEVTARRIMTIEAPLFRQRNLSKETFRRMPILFGHANIELFDHARRCVEYERLVDKDGRNVYVTQDNIVNNLTMPLCLMHGKDNDLFALESSTRSARLIAGFRGDKGVYDAAKDAYDYSKGDRMRTIFLRGLGHLDPIIGSEAHNTFEQVVKFFDDAFSGQPPAPDASKTAPPTGKNTFGYGLPVKRVIK